MNRHLLSVLDYFGYFSYAPSFDEIHTFLPCIINKKNLSALLDKEVKNKSILRLPNNKQFGLFPRPANHYSLATNHYGYTLPQYSTRGHQNKNKWTVKTIQTYLSFLRHLPFVRFVGVTGASAMEGLRENDDLDLCIVTKHHLLWTTRFFAIVLAKLCRLHTKTGVCLNLFFDESDLVIPKKKQNVYIAHELLQMKPIVDKDRVYQRFFNENGWIYRYFPNAKQRVILGTPPWRMTIWHPFEHFLKYIQLPVIRRNRTAFFITQTQLWLFKNDFEKKLKRRGLVI